MDEKLKFYYDQYKSIMGDAWDEATLLENARFMADKQKTIKRGENVLHIVYIKGLLTDDDLENIQTELQKIGLELSSYDKTGVPYASLDELTGVVRQMLSSTVTQNILMGAAGSALWAGLAQIWIYTYRRLKGKKTTKQSISGHTTTKDATMSIVVKINPTTSVEYNLRGDFGTDEEAFETFQKMLENAKSLAPNEIPRRPLVAKVDFDTKSVEMIDEEQFFRDKIAHQKKNEKKDNRKYPRKKNKKKK